MLGKGYGRFSFSFLELAACWISNFIEILRILVVSPADIPPVVIFLAFPLDFHCVANSGNRMMAMPPLAPPAGWMSGPWCIK